jgi:hypothetical protein
VDPPAVEPLANPDVWVHHCVALFQLPLASLLQSHCLQTIMVHDCFGTPQAYRPWRATQQQCQAWQAGSMGVTGASVQRVFGRPLLQFVLDRVEKARRIAAVEYAMVE